MYDTIIEFALSFSVAKSPLPAPFILLGRI